MSSRIDGYISSRLNIGEEDMKRLSFEAECGPDGVFYETPIPHIKNIRWTRRKYEFARRQLIDEGLSRGDRIVDMGCGFGVGTHILSWYFDVVGIESHEPLCDFCIKTWPEFEFLCMDAAEVDIEKFDGFVAIDVIEHFTDPLGALRRWGVDMEGILVGRTIEKGNMAGRREDVKKYGLSFHEEFTRDELRECIPDVKIYYRESEIPSYFWFTFGGVRS